MRRRDAPLADHVVGVLHVDPLEFASGLGQFQLEFGLLDFQLGLLHGEPQLVDFGLRYAFREAAFRVQGALQFGVGHFVRFASEAHLDVVVRFLVGGQQLHLGAAFVELRVGILDLGDRRAGLDHFAFAR